MAADDLNSFNKLLEQALTFGVKKVSPSVLPQFIGCIVYLGLIAAVWTTFSLKLDPRIAAAGVVLLAMAAIMTILLLMGKQISPMVLNVLVILVVVGLLAIGSLAVVKIVQPDSVMEIGLAGNLRYTDQTSARDYVVSLEGHQNGVPTGADGYFYLPISRDDIYDQHVNLHIESLDHKYAEKQNVPVNPSAITRTTVVLKIAKKEPSEEGSGRSVTRSESAEPSPQTDSPRLSADVERSVATQPIETLAQSKVFDALFAKLASSNTPEEKAKKPLKDVYNALLDLQEARVKLIDVLGLRIKDMEAGRQDEAANMRARTLDDNAENTRRALEHLGRVFLRIRADLDVQDPVLTHKLWRYMSGQNPLLAEPLPKEVVELRQIKTTLDRNSRLLDTVITNFRALVKAHYPHLGDLMSAGRGRQLTRAA